MQNTPVTLKLVKKVIIDLDSSEMSGLNCAPLAVLKKCEAKLSKMSEGILLSRLLESLMCCPCI